LTSRLPELDLDALDDERRAIVEHVMAGRGRLPTPFRVWIASPELARALAPLGEFLASRVSLSKAEAEIAVLLAAQHVGADYVLATHAREAIAAGLAEEAVDALIAGRLPEFADPRQRAMCAMALALLDRGTPSQEVFDAAVAALGHDGVAEGIALAGYFTAVGLAMKLFAVPPPAAAR
jgi:4-carboxymuconolactone decarboxylase